MKSLTEAMVAVVVSDAAARCCWRAAREVRVREARRGEAAEEGAEKTRVARDPTTTSLLDDLVLDEEEARTVRGDNVEDLVADADDLMSVMGRARKLMDAAARIIWMGGGAVRRFVRSRARASASFLSVEDEYR